MNNETVSVMDLRSHYAGHAGDPLELPPIEYTSTLTTDELVFAQAQQRFERDAILHPRKIRPVTHG